MDKQKLLVSYQKLVKNIGIEIGCNKYKEAIEDGKLLLAWLQCMLEEKEVENGKAEIVS